MRLHDFYDMPWYEFILKKIAFYRHRNHNEKEKWYQTRFIAYHTRVAPHYKPHQSWLTENGLERFLPIDTESKPIKRISPERRESHLKEYEEYLRIKNSKK